MIAGVAAELVLDARADLAEGPVWDAARGALEWLDVDRGDWHRLDRNRTGRPPRHVGDRVSCVRPREAGGHALAVDGDIALLAAGGELERRLAVPAAAGAVLNDGCCDPAGRLLVGSVVPGTAEGALHRVDGDGTVTVLRHGVAMSNGIAFSPDGSRLYHVDSGAGTVDVLAYDVELGTARPARRLVDVTPTDGLPDGLAVDADGGLWLAIWGAGEVRRYAPDGRLDGRVTVPVAQVTSCALGGGRLWITTARQGMSAEALAGEPLAGGIFGCDVGCGPAPAHAFSG